jgi:ribonuclease D
LTAWRDNDARLRPLTLSSFLVKEVAATSQDLSSLATVGLAALDFLSKASPAPNDWKAQQLAIIEQAKTPKSQLLLMPAPAVQKLLEAVSAGGSCVGAK